MCVEIECCNPPPKKTQQLTYLLGGKASAFLSLCVLKVNEKFMRVSNHCNNRLKNMVKVPLFRLDTMFGCF